MKTSLFLLVSCLLFALQVNGEQVFDTDKQEVRPGHTYYILPATAGNGGGVTLTRGGNASCPLNVFQSPNQQSKGLAIQLLMVNSSAGLIIDINEDINIKFADWRYVSVCNMSTVWKIKDGLVTTGGVKGGSANGTDTCLFTIQKYEDAYVLQYCPRARGCSFICPRLACGYIGIEQVNGSRRLAVNRRPFKVVFQKA